MELTAAHVNVTNLLLAVAFSKDVLVFDLRSGRIVRHFLGLHSDIISTVQFHPSNPRFLFTGAEDNIVNVLDLTVENADDALISTFPAESQIEKIGFACVGQKNLLWVMTFTHEFSLWDIQEEERIARIESANQKLGSDYLISANCQTGRLFLIGGTYGGDIQIGNFESNEIRLLATVPHGGKGSPHPHAHNAFIRSFCPIGPNFEGMFTGGEDARLCMWQLTSTGH